jgi:hypothetical protein
MPRTTPDLVQSTNTDLDPSIDLTGPILAANELVTEICAPVVSYSNTRLELIERYLAAHFASIDQFKATFSGAGQVQESSASKVDLGFDYTVYGQNAMRLDTAGGLAALNNRLKVIQSGGGSTAGSRFGVVYYGEEDNRR